MKLIRKPMKMPPLLALAIIILVIILCACGGGDNTAQAPTQAFLPLPPPVNGTYPLNLQMLNIGGVQSQSILSPNIAVQYGKTTSGIGGTQSEDVTLKQIGRDGVMLSVKWGDYQKGEIQRTEYYSSSGQLLGGIVQLTVTQGSLFQWLAGNFSYT